MKTALNDEVQWYVMPQTREYRIDKGRSIDKLKQFKKLGDTILLLHERYIYHRDIKPANILFYKNRPCLTDFGLVWNNEIAPHVTGRYEPIGPANICPPEMEHGYDKMIGLKMDRVDVYLFAKTLWIYLTGNMRGFRGTYNRGDRQIYLNRDTLSLGNTIEPLHIMMEKATLYENLERISMADCLTYINQQIDIAEENMASAEIQAFLHEEVVNAVKSQNLSDAIVFRKLDRIQNALSKMNVIMEMNILEFESESPFGIFKSAAVSVVSEGIFEITVDRTT